MSAVFESWLEARRAAVEAALVAWLPRSPHVPAVIAEAMRYSVNAGGKRLRPLLVLAAAEGSAWAEGASEAAARDAAMSAACAIEMIHTYSLIHDDLPAMDDDALRRGQPTSHVVFGEGMAILAGDGLQAEAFALLAREPQGHHPTLLARKVKTLAVIADAAGAAGMVGGQAVDLDAVKPASAKATAGEAARTASPLTPESLTDMHLRKTGALIRASVRAGAVMGGASDDIYAALDAYGHEVGLAFQIVDDVLDEEGTASTLGKTAGKDKAAGKPTYPAFFGLERSKQLAGECRDKAMAALDRAGLLDSQLANIATWVIDRKA